MTFANFATRIFEKNEHSYIFSKIIALLLLFLKKNCNFVGVFKNT